MAACKSRLVRFTKCHTIFRQVTVDRCERQPRKTDMNDLIDVFAGIDAIKLAAKAMLRQAQVNLADLSRMRFKQLVLAQLAKAEATALPGSSKLVSKKRQRAGSSQRSRSFVMRPALVTVKTMVSVIGVHGYARVGGGKSLHAIHRDVAVFFTKVRHHRAFGLTCNF